MSGSRKKVAVIGAGVSGLSTAVILAESIALGRAADAVDITIFADKFSPETCSDGAAGLIKTVLVQGTDPTKVTRWMKATADWLFHQARSPSASEKGIFICPTFDCCDEEIKDPGWATCVRGFRHLTDQEREEISPLAKTGFFYLTAIVEGCLYLPWLTKRFKALGGHLVKRTIHDFSELSREFDVVVNCSGLRARWLCNDPNMVPIRGQVLRVHAPWVKHVIDFNTVQGFTYVIPNTDVVVIGGTIQDGNWSEQVDPVDRKRILDRTAALLPSLENARIVSEWTGLRPCRMNGVRLEKEDIRTKHGKTLPVVHNYGHAGAGLTLHWGCARDAASLVLESLFSSGSCQLAPQEHFDKSRL